MTALAYSARRILWASRETVSDWDCSSATNTAGFLDLATEGILVCGKATRAATLVWSTIDLWAITWIGGDLIFRAEKVGSNCGIIGPHASVVLDTGAYWMGTKGFFVFDGFARPLPCDVLDYVFGSFNRTYAYMVFAYTNPAYNEITWHYPSGAATTNDRYVTYNYIENHWVTGTLSRQAGVTRVGSGVVPVLINASGEIFDHETGTGRNSEGTPSLESGPLEIGDGDHLAQIQSIVPDDKTVGDVNLTLYGAPNPDTAETTHGPYTLTARTTLRVKARQIRVKLTETVANAWRVGVIRPGVVPSSRR